MTDPTLSCQQDEDAEVESDWETASDEDETEAREGDSGAAAPETEEWDTCRSLFDNKVSAGMEANLEYMWKNFGFYLPDSQFLEDPEGLIRYLVSFQ